MSFPNQQLQAQRMIQKWGFGALSLRLQIYFEWCGFVWRWIVSPAKALLPDDGHPDVPHQPNLPTTFPPRNQPRTCESPHFCYLWWQERKTLHFFLAFFWEPVNTQQIHNWALQSTEVSLILNLQVVKHWNESCWLGAPWLVDFLRVWRICMAIGGTGNLKSPFSRQKTMKKCQLPCQFPAKVWFNAGRKVSILKWPQGLATVFFQFSKDGIINSDQLST